MAGELSNYATSISVSSAISSALSSYDNSSQVDRSPSISGLRNAYYIILASPAHPGGVWTKSYQVYSESVRAFGGPKGSFAPSSSSHSFASLAEAEAYILGSGRPWPPQHQ